MPTISWSDKFSIGVEMIDEQHKNLFRLVNDLNSNITGGSSKQALSSALDALIDYTKYHFKEEEDYMFNVEYPRLEQHKIAHDNLTQQVLDFEQALSEGKGDVSKFLEFLYDWLTKHIMDQDKKIGKYMDIKLLKPIL